MRICGVIAEYNPLHFGHVYHLEQARRVSGADAVVVVMSGPVVQRGECACFEPQARAAWAVEAGADLVLELPAAYACGSAQRFARGAVGLLTALGCVESFAFGCESGELSGLWEAAQLLYREPEGFSARLRAFLKQGASYPRARQLALEAELGDRAGALLTQANNVLALEYLQALLHLESPLTPLAILRRGDGYRDREATGVFPSATAIRAALSRGERPQGMPEGAAEALAGRAPLLPGALGPLVRWMLLTSGEEKLAQLPDMGEGLHLRLIRAAQENTGYEAMVQAALTRRYSEPRIKRAMLHGLLGMDQGDADMLLRELPLFIRPLAMGEKGPQLLSRMAHASDAALVTHPARYAPQNPAEARLWEINRRAWQLFALLDHREDGWEKSTRLVPMKGENRK